MKRQFVAWAVCLLVVSACQPGPAPISVSVGPTPIPRGNAQGSKDITVSNGLFAAAFAVDTAPPWGVARGGIVDIAIQRGDGLDYDIASLVDFMPNNWSSWPTTYQRVSIEKQSDEELVVRTERDWGEVELTTRFRFRAADRRVHMVTEMTNKGTTALTDLLSGYVAWPDGGNLLADPVRVGGGEANGWTAAYDESWMLGLHAPFSDIADRLGRDRYLAHSLAAGESRRFEAWLQVEDTGSLAAMIETEIETGELAWGRLHGSVTSDDGARIERPALVIMRAGEALAWTIGTAGSYDLRLPVGDYEVYATASGYGRGALRPVTIEAGADLGLDFDDVRLPGAIDIEVAADGQPVDARIRIVSGQKPVIAYFGKDVFFTELARAGQLSEVMAPGDYVLEIDAGANFIALPMRVDLVVAAGETSELRVDIPLQASPQARGWYSADLHHHSDVLDGFTDPEYVLRSQLAAGVDIGFLSDHDSVVNNAAMSRLAASRDMPFIPATELSPSWGHFNAYPLDDGKTVDIDTGQARVGEIFREARRLGADVIAVNHPYSEYGYFTSLEHSLVPGGYDPGFDVLEIGPVFEASGQAVKNQETLQRAWDLWNAGQRAYLVGGSDVHDVWSSVSARARTFVHVTGDLEIEAFMAALMAGHSYVSQGPLVFPEILFGSTQFLAPGESLVLNYDVQAVLGLESVTLVANGRELAHDSLAGEREPVAISFSVKPKGDSWYSLIVEDKHGRIAYTNPVWVKTLADEGSN